MALDKFINNIRTKVAEKYNLKSDAEIDAFFLGMEESAKDNQEILEKRDKMLRDTVAELCEAKRLLRLSVEDMKNVNYCSEICCRDSFACRVSDTCDFKWRYADEVKKLIGDEPNGI